MMTILKLIALAACVLQATATPQPRASGWDSAGYVGHYVGATGVTKVFSAEQCIALNTCVNGILATFPEYAGDFQVQSYPGCTLVPVTPGTGPSSEPGNSGDLQSLGTALIQSKGGPNDDGSAPPMVQFCSNLVNSLFPNGAGRGGVTTNAFRYYRWP